ncbi:hypothetical protein DPEC_G00217340 [Dallia pectoralis]|uniref:Uncharacterized protein n=1 Tax=Dallia pectoralis TaxID=75939 RepID=A0ACC2G312_DALPE|nr:hypothetical protein DPEC_G00217340 [Dallia pectoralis]
MDEALSTVEAPWIGGAHMFGSSLCVVISAGRLLLLETLVFITSLLDRAPPGSPREVALVTACSLERFSDGPALAEPSESLLLFILHSLRSVRTLEIYFFEFFSLKMRKTINS